MKLLRRKRKKLNQGLSDNVFNTILVVVVTIILMIVLYPIIYIVSSSFSSGNAVTSGKVLFWPVDFCIDGYKIVFQNKAVLLGYMNSILYTVLGSVLHLVMTILIAYPLSRKNYQGRNLLTTIFMIPMFFGGGLIPTYILVSQLGLVDTRLWMVITGAVGTSHIIIMRTFFQTSIPNDLLESAKLDGITDIGYLFKIVIPLSKASISVILLYAIVDKWNSYFTPMLYLKDRAKYPLQLILREILSASQVDMSMFSDAGAMAQLASAYDTMKYALIVVSTVPMLILYPFVQKFFAKGVMMGSLKG